MPIGGKENPDYLLFWPGPPPLQADPLLEEPFCAALLARLRFRSALHQALTHLDKGPTHEKSTLGAQQAIATAAKELAIIRISSPQLARASERVTSAGASGRVTSAGASGGETSAGGSEEVTAAGTSERVTSAGGSGALRDVEGVGKSGEGKEPTAGSTERSEGTSKEASISSQTDGAASRGGFEQPGAATVEKGAPSGSGRSRKSVRGVGQAVGGIAEAREEGRDSEGGPGASTPAQPSTAFSNDTLGRRESRDGAEAIAASLQASVLSERGHDAETGPGSSERVSSGATYVAPSETPHSRDRMPCTIHLREGGSTYAPIPTPSEAAGIIAGQPPIHTRDLREGVTGTAEASTASGRPAIGFDESVNRRLLGSTPPRSMKMLTWAEVSDSLNWSSSITFGVRVAVKFVSAWRDTPGSRQFIP